MNFNNLLAQENTDDLDQLNIDHDASHKSFVSLCYTNKTLGISCYSELTNTIYTDYITVSSSDMNDILINLKIKFSPTLFIIHPTLVSNQAILDLILCSADGLNKEYYKYKSLKSSCWNPELSMELICSKLYVKKLHMNHHHNHHTNTMNPTTTLQHYSTTTTYNHSIDIRYNLFLLSSVIDMENQHLKSSLGALLSFMTTNLFQLENGIIQIADLQLLNISDYLKLDDITMNALQIFTQDIHPNVIKETSKNKEGFSLFTLFDRTRSFLGRQTLKNWMKQPYYNMEKISLRLDAIDLVVDIENREFIQNIIKLLRKIGNTDINRLVFAFILFLLLLLLLVLHHF